jgi:hypothetical protein
MKGRMLREGIWTDKALARLDAYYQDQVPRWILLSDDRGRFNADPDVIKGRAYPKRKEDANKILEIRQALYDIGMLFIWRVGDNEYGYWVGWWKNQWLGRTQYDDEGNQVKFRSSIPEPPADELAQYMAEHNKIQDNLEQVRTKQPREDKETITEEEQKVWDTWQAGKTTKHHKKMTPEDLQAIRNTVKNGHSLETQVKAIIGYDTTTDPFWVEFKQGTGAWGLSEFLRIKGCKWVEAFSKEMEETKVLAPPPVLVRPKTVAELKDLIEKEKNE